MSTLSSSRTAINCTHGPGSGAKIVNAPSKFGIFTPLIQGSRLSASLSSKREMRNDIEMVAAWLDYRSAQMM